VSARIVLSNCAQAGYTNASKSEETPGWREVITAKAFYFAGNFSSGTGENFFEELVTGWTSKPDHEAGRLFRSNCR
jgi:hypothetical protein